MNDSQIYRNMKITRDERAVKLGCSDSCGLHHSTHRKGDHSKLLVALMLLAGSLVSKFHFQLTKKSYRKVLEKVRHSPIW